jgi:4-amino-4-deoxy-L-arabinose transferase-like glycosyltransferase
VYAPEHSIVAEFTHTVTRRNIEPNLIVVIGILAAVTIVRLVGLMTSDVDLFIDESQYWSWSRELSWGYFSKPPLVAWVIHIAESVCGSSETCIRAPSPIFYFGTCIIIFLTARRLYGPVVGFWAALLMMFGIALVFSSRIISTDVPLVFFWALALWAYVNLLERANWQWATVLGLSIGLGILAKYAMGYFMLGMLLAARFDSRAHDLLRSRFVWLVLGIAGAVAAPNLVWVLQHNLVTLRSIAGVVQTDKGFGLHPLATLEFLAAQFAIFGPIVFAVLLYAIAKVRSPEEVPASRIMLAFAIPPLVIVTLVALFSHAYANWAATSVVSGTIFAAAFLVHRKAWRWLAFSIALGVLAQSVLLFGDAAAYRIAIPLLPPGKSDIYNRSLGFRALADQAGRFATLVGAKTIVGEDRRALAALLYYLRNAPQQILAWPSPGVPTFDMTRPLTESAQQPIIFVTECPFLKRLSIHYAAVEKIGEIRPPTGPTSSRYYVVFNLSGPRGELTPLPKCIRE